VLEKARFWTKLATAYYPRVRHRLETWKEPLQLLRSFCWMFALILGGSVPLSIAHADKIMQHQTTSTLLILDNEARKSSCRYCLYWIEPTSV